MKQLTLETARQDFDSCTRAVITTCQPILDKLNGTPVADNLENEQWILAADTTKLVVEARASGSVMTTLERKALANLIVMIWLHSWFEDLELYDNLRFKDAIISLAEKLDAHAAFVEELVNKDSPVSQPSSEREAAVSDLYKVLTKANDDTVEILAQYFVQEAVAGD